MDRRELPRVEYCPLCEEIVHLRPEEEPRKRIRGSSAPESHRARNAASWEHFVLHRAALSTKSRLNLSIGGKVNPRLIAVLIPPNEA